MDSNVGLAIQCVGILLVTLLSLFMRGSIAGSSLKYWTIAWASLAAALVSLFFGFQVDGDKRFFYFLYFLGEYAFGLMFIAGCQNHVTGKYIGRIHTYLLAVAVIGAAILPFLSADFNDLFMVQATILAVLFATALFVLRSGLTSVVNTPGIRVMSVALLLLSISFLHYVPAFGARKGLWGVTVPSGYLKYTSIVDLILEILLGFGTTMVLMERVRREVEQANGKLVDALDKLELLARLDPLTEALNRHAFHSLLSRSEGCVEANDSGCVAVIDVDNLKQINDSLGHTAGDRAIRAVAKAIRTLIRADDMLFRWGGDEFLVLMFRLSESEARRRMLTLNAVLAKNCEQWTSMPMRVTVSHGLTGFGSLTTLGRAIEAADREMYDWRQQLRKLKGVGSIVA